MMPMPMALASLPGPPSVQRQHALRRLAATCALLFAALLALTNVQARERILSYDSQVAVHADGSLDVREDIVVQADGEQIRRGIFRDFPTRYRDRHGNAVVVDLEVLEVLRDGAPEPWFTESRGNGVRINTGNDDLLPTPARIHYTLRYRTTRQLGFFDGHDELYWNAIGTGWDFTIESGSVQVTLPEAVQTAAMQADAFTGGAGGRGRDFHASLPAPGQARWELHRPLSPGEGMTVVLTFPKGIVAEPSAAQRTAWLLTDNAGALVALAGLVLLWLVGLPLWLRHGRDPKAGPVVVEYDPPMGLSPSVLRRIERVHADARGFSADVLALAVAGKLVMEQEKARWSQTWRLTLRDADPAGLADSQAQLLADLFAQGPVVEIRASHAEQMQKLVQAHDKRTANVVGTTFHGPLFQYNGGSLLLVIVIAVVFAFAAISVAEQTGTGMLLTLAIVAAIVASTVALCILIPRVTAEGRRARDRIEGFRRYLKVADREELARLQPPGREPPPLDAARFEAMLPYAVALGVEDAWTGKFTAAVGAAAAASATAAMAWYRGPGGVGMTDLSGFGKTVSSAFASQIAAASTPPGSSSGAGGGGSVGGGGGGGGGGGR